MVVSQFVLKDLKMGVVETQYFLSSSTAFWLFTASLLTEVPVMLKRDAFSILFNNVGYFFSAAILGIIVNFLTFFVIVYTSSLNVKILGMFRNMMLIVVSVVFYAEQVTLIEIIGYVLALIGFIG